ncbi:15258_t:CDS:2, partial [Racocetra persica]
NPLYKDDFYADGGKLFCRFCQTTVDHDQKSNPQKTPVQRAITTFHKPYDEKEQFVLDFIKILAEADIFFEKIQYFQSFLKVHCKY